MACSRAYSLSDLNQQSVCAKSSGGSLPSTDYVLGLGYFYEKASNRATPSTNQFTADTGYTILSPVDQRTSKRHNQSPMY
jgi:hypothetical protein